MKLPLMTWLVIFLVLAPSLQADSIGTAFTYQGELHQLGEPANGAFDFHFNLYNMTLEGSPLTSAIQIDDAVVANGIFTVKLDFGSVMLEGQNYWLEVAVKAASGGDEFTILSPRQELTSTPSSIVSLKALSVADKSIDRAAIDATEVQLRVTGRCLPGLNFSRIDVSGEVECLAREVLCPPGWGMSGLDASGNAICFWTGIEESSEFIVQTVNTSGSISSLAVGSNGLPLFAYFNGVELLVSSCTSPNCQTPVTNTIETLSGQYGIFPDVSIGSDGFPILSYIEAFEDGPSNSAFVKFAKCQDVSCSEPAIITTIEQICENDCEYFEFGSSIASGSQGNPIISYTDKTTSSLKVASCSTLDCAGLKSISSLDDSSSGFSDLMVGSDGLPMIAYDATQEGIVIKLAHCIDAECTNPPQITFLGQGVFGWHHSLTLNIDGFPIIAWNSNGRIMIARCKNYSCSENELTNFDPPTATLSPSIALASNGFPIIVAYADPPIYGLYFFKCLDSACALPVETDIFLELDNIDQKVNLAIGSDGRPIASFWNGTDSMLQVLICGDRACTQ
jgi:hypothetical protein